MNGGSPVRFAVEGTATYATQLSYVLCGKSAEESVSATGATPYSNPATGLADVARLAYCLLIPPIRASFRKKMIEDAMTSKVLQ